MVGYPYDFLANPLGAVRSTFDKAVASGSDPTVTNGRDWGALDLFRDFLSDHAVFSQVPILNAGNIGLIQPNTLVRFRGMVQDMLGNEFYAGAYKDGSTWRTNKYTDVPQFPMDSSCDPLVWERRLLYCVPVPGQNTWTQSSSENVMNSYANMSSTQREKRQRDDDIATDDMELQGFNEEDKVTPCVKKMREDVPPSVSSSQEATAEIGSPSMDMEQDFDRNSLPCLVKVYDSLEADLKLNEIFDFIGILTFDSVLEPSKHGIDEFTDIDELIQLPSSKVPRLHCLVHRKLGAQDFLSSASTIETSKSVKETRARLLAHLTSVLGNDDLAAQYLLLHLLSGVHARVDTLAVGKLSLNFTGLNNESVSILGNRLNAAIENLLPFTHYMPLSVNYLNNASLVPKKDYQQNRLVPGVLQLAEGSHLMIDETQMQAGTLNTVGVENITSLKNLMDLQKVEYDFTYYKMEMPADVQILVLSQAKSNILPADIVLPFHPNSTEISEITDEETLKAWRFYLARYRLLPHSMDPEMQKVVENDIVAARQADRSLGTEDFSRWLTMGRLISASFGETSLLLEHWQMVKELERLRRERINYRQGNGNGVL